MQTTVNRYQIKKELGRGGMATVFLAYDTYREQDVALKVLPHHFLHDKTFRERFEREARMMIRLEHYAIVPVYDFGEQDGQPYIAMRLMRGGSLADRLTNGPLAPDEIGAIMRRICAALEKAHSINVIHRDLKPGNILFDDEEMAYLSDFGVARLIEGTQTVTVVGTPQYMAPEQAHGHALDGRTDVYQMGVVLFQMLTGRVPFEAATTPALLHKHAYAPIPSVLEHNATLPAGCQAIVEKALAKEKGERYTSATELVDDLDTAFGFAENQKARPAAVPPVKDTPIPKADKSSSINRRFMAIGLAIIVFAVLGGAFIAGNNLFSRSEATPPARAALTTVTETPTSQPTATQTATSLPTLTSTRRATATATEAASATPAATATAATPLANVLATPSATATIRPTSTSTPAQPPQIILFNGETLQSPITFEWSGPSTLEYRVVLRHRTEDHEHMSEWIGGTSWTFDIPANEFGGWEWFVEGSNGLRSVSDEFWFDPFPGRQPPQPTNPPPIREPTPTTVPEDD